MINQLMIKTASMMKLEQLQERINVVSVVRTYKWLNTTQ